MNPVSVPRETGTVLQFITGSKNLAASLCRTGQRVSVLTVQSHLVQLGHHNVPTGSEAHIPRYTIRVKGTACRQAVPI
jgi:hypothetical protein